MALPRAAVLAAVAVDTWQAHFAAYVLALVPWALAIPLVHGGHATPLIVTAAAPVVRVGSCPSRLRSWSLSGRQWWDVVYASPGRNARRRQGWSDCCCEADPRLAGGIHDCC